MGIAKGDIVLYLISRMSPFSLPLFVPPHENTQGERQGVSPPSKPHRKIDNHLQNTLSAVSDRGTRWPWKVGEFRRPVGEFRRHLHVIVGTTESNAIGWPPQSAIH